MAAEARPERRGTDEVLVLGGGLAGVSAAHRLAELGRPVTLVEARPGLGEGASFANGAMLTPSLADPWNAPGVLGVMLRSFLDPGSPMKLRAKAVPSLIGWGLKFLAHARPGPHARATERILALARYSLEAFEPYRATEGAHIDAERCGTMKLFRDPGAFEASRTASARLAPMGLRHEALDRDGALTAEPALAPIAEHIAGAIRYPDDQVADGAAFCRVLGRRLTAMGGTVLTGRRVAGLIREAGRVAGAETDQGPIRAGATVLALGSDPDGIAARAGLRLAIRPAKGYSLTYDATGLEARPRIPVIDEALHAGVVPLGGRIRVVGTAEFTGHDARITPARIANLEALLGRIYPRLAPALARRGPTPWAGFRPMSADGLPYIGPAGPPGLWVDMGYGHLGWTLAVGSAHLLGDLMTGRRPEIDPAWVAPQR